MSEARRRQRADLVRCEASSWISIVAGVLPAERHPARDQSASRGTAASSRRRHAAVGARLGAVVDQVHEAGVLERRLGHQRAVWRGPACSTSSRQNELLLQVRLDEHGVAPVVAAALDHDRVGRHARRRHLWPPSPDCRRDTITFAALEKTPASSISSVPTSRQRAASSSSLSSAAAALATDGAAAAVAGASARRAARS